jgi:hypothetical protein
MQPPEHAEAQSHLARPQQRPHTRWARLRPAVPRQGIAIECGPGSRMRRRKPSCTRSAGELLHCPASTQRQCPAFAARIAATSSSRDGHARASWRGDGRRRAPSPAGQRCPGLAVPLEAEAGLPGERLVSPSAVYRAGVGRQHLAHGSPQGLRRLEFRQQFRGLLRSRLGWSLDAMIRLLGGRAVSVWPASREPGL